MSAIAGSSLAISRRYSSRPGSGEKAGTVFTTDAKFYDPVDSLFLRNYGPCTKKKPILLQGPWAQDFKDFLEKRAVERAKKKTSGCNLLYEERNAEECGWWREDTSKDWLDFFVLSETKVESLCAAVLWPDGAQKGTYTIDINRTIGYMNGKAKFYPGYTTRYDNLFVEPKCSDPYECRNFQRYFWEPDSATKCVQPGCSPSSRGSYYSDDKSVKTELQVLLTQFAQWGGKAALGFPYLTPKAEDSDFERPLSISVMGFPRLVTDDSGSNRYSIAPLGFYMLGGFLSWVFVGWTLANVGRLVREREEKRKEGLRMIGCTNTAYYLHWLLYGALVSLVYCVLFTAIFTYFQIVSGSRILVLSLCVILFFLDVTMVSYVFSCFFSAALLGQLISLVLYTFLCSAAFLPATSSGSTLLLFLPTVGWSQMMGLLVYDSAYGTLEGFKGPSIAVILLFLCVDFFLYLGLWLYFDQVISHNGSNTLSYFFPCSPDYWKGEDGIVRDPSPGTEMREMRLSHQQEPPTNAPESAGRSSNALLGSAEAAASAPRRSIDEMMSRQGRNSLIEPVDQALMAKALAKECVTINGLCVYFRGVHGEEIRAVDGVDLAMYPGEIFALLGHNGAGKSTTMSALSGLVRSSKGSIDVFGSKVPEDLVTVRKTMGFCPQHDVLFPDMTVAEHFQLFCAVAGRNAIDDAELMQLATAVGLARRAGFGVQALSGGMKRKLSVGLAFAGEPKLVILDEPTSGMDPYSRRGLWDFLKERREGRVLLLTTHFMDEAEVLGDRVAIMRAGQVQACGTPGFLKRRFGCGYVLTVVMQQRGDSHEPVKELLLGALSSGIQISGVGKEILANVPLEKESSLAGCLSQLSAHREALNIATFGVSVTNLEEVFLKVASGNTASKGHADEVEKSFHEASIAQEQTDTGPAFVMPNPGGTVAQQLLALFLRRGRTAIRDTKAFMVGCLLPVIIILLAALQGYAILRGGDPPPAMQAVSMVDMAKSLNVMYAVSEPRPDGEKLPDGVVVLPDKPPRGIDEHGNFRCEYDSSGCIFSREAKKFQKYTPWGYLSHCMSGDFTRKQACLERFLSYSLSFAETLVDKAQNGDPQDLGVLLVDGFPLVTVDKARVPNSIPIAFNELFNKVGEPADVKPTYKIMEMTRPQAEYYTQSGFLLQLGAGLLTCVLSNFGFSFIPIAVLGFVLMEKNKEVKHQLLISGCAARAYWLSMLLWDCMVAMLPVMALFFFLWMVGMDAYTTYWKETIILLLLFTPAAVGIAYVLSHVTSSPIAGNIFLSVCNGICVVFLVVIFLLLDIFLKVLPLTAAFELDPKTAGVQDLQDVKDAAQGNCANLEPQSTLAIECLWASRAKLWGPLVALSGYVLPSFGLLDGLLRISLRHNLVKVGIPTLVEMAGEQAGSMLVNTAWGAVFQGCGKPQTPLPETASCSQYRAEERSDMCVIDQTLGSFQAMVSQVLAPQLAYIFQQMEIVVGENVPKEQRDAIIRALDQQKQRILEGISGSGGPNMMEQMLLGAALQWVPAEEQHGWERLAMCSMQLNQTSTAIASIAKAFGDKNVGDKIRDWFSDLAKSKGLRDSADRMLPPLGTSWDKCTMGPELGPWALSKLLGIPMSSETLKELDGLALGPVYVKIPCDLGLKGPAGNLIKTLVVIPTVGRAQLQLALLCFLFPFVAILMEDISQSPKFAKWAVNKTPVPPELLSLEDDDVKAEKERVANVDPRRQIMYVRGLRKAYGGWLGATTHAVRGVTWASDSGMVFGLLGVNGAGKTTSFKMMSGILTPSEGEVRILGIDIVEETARARRLIGYCPQFDALIDMLTVQDHLYMYARVKGLAGTDLTRAVNEKISEMQLEQYRDRRAGTLSGGNKRKLSVAMAIIGEPPVIFLDEPSTGMDPFARRFMWSVIQDVAEKRKQSVVVLTTHSMEEAEALCSSIAIQVDGQLRCLGAAQALKSKYGQGYEVAVKFAAPPSEVLQQTLQERLPEGHNSPTDIIPSGVALGALPAEARAAAQEASGCIPPGKLEIQAVVLAEWLVMRGKLQGLLEFLQTELQLDNVSVQEFHSSSARIRLGSVGDTELPGLFGAFSESRGRLGLSDFSVCQASLEQIFNSFAANAGAAAAPS